ncbi:MAG: DEAD/DEAH box helicase, partial [Planctomycetes bacterium]|nr:DEAD/DEAH box helicase [Planctomycetota bacterium]
MIASMPLDLLHPLLRDWFDQRFGEPTEPQRLGWPHIAAGRNTLIAAPTGSGKTLAAFMFCLDRLFRQSVQGELPEGVQ